MSKATPVTAAADTVLYPIDLQQRYRKSGVTIWRRERDKILPPRDVYRGGEPVGWYLSTIVASERRPAETAGGVS